MVILSTETVNLQPFGIDVPSWASCESEAAPAQYQIRRALCRVTSLPLCATSVPNSTPLRSPRMITFFPMFVSIVFFILGLLYFYVVYLLMLPLIVEQSPSMLSHLTLPLIVPTLPLTV